MCVFFPFILDIKFVGRTSRGHTGGRSYRISHPPSFCGACLNFSREKDSAIPSLVDCEVEFCVLTIYYSFSTRWAFFSVLFFFLRKIPFAGIELTSQRVRGLRGTSELPGRPAAELYTEQLAAHQFVRRVRISDDHSSTKHKQRSAPRNQNRGG